MSVFPSSAYSFCCYIPSDNSLLVVGIETGLEDTSMSLANAEFTKHKFCVIQFVQSL
jgi:hypothetical protein